MPVLPWWLLTGNKKTAAKLVPTVQHSRVDQKHSRSVPWNFGHGVFNWQSMPIYWTSLPPYNRESSLQNSSVTAPRLKSRCWVSANKRLQAVASADKSAYGIRQRPRSGLAGRPRAVRDCKCADMCKIIFLSQKSYLRTEIDGIKEYFHDLKAKYQVIGSKSFP